MSEDQKQQNSTTVSDELVRQCVHYLKVCFLAWRTPPVDLPAESVIEDVVRHIIEAGKSA